MENWAFEFSDISNLKSKFGFSGLSGLRRMDHDQSFFFWIVFLK